MARLIDAEALVKALLDRSFYPTAVRRAIEKAPAIDAELVVRCKDCKHMGPHPNYRWCNVWHAINGMGDEGFCNYGERYTDD